MLPLFRELGLNVEEQHAILVRLGRNRRLGLDRFLQAGIVSFYFLSVKYSRDLN